MTDLQSTLDAIDALQQLCGTCDEPLGPDAPSPFWCSQDCSDVWNADRSEALVGYREPYDVPEHIGNQWEQCSRETTAPWDWAGLAMDLWGNAYFTVDEHRALRPIVPESFVRAMANAWADFERRMAPSVLDVEAIQRHIDRFETLQTSRRALRRIDPRRPR